jgi:hypothetical protein
MKRRDFIRTSAGLLALATSPGLWAVENTFAPKKNFQFKVFNPGKTLVPITQVTPDDGHYVQTYFDVTPFSPSQRLLAGTRFPFQNRMPVLGDIADVCVIDLDARTIRTVFKTKCWGFQTGGNVNWGASDRHVYANDVINSTAVGVRIDLETGETKACAGPLYHMAPDESCFVGFPHELRDVTQLGYGVPSKDPKNPPHLPPGAPKTEGIWKTDLKTNKKTLLVSIADVAAKVPTPPPVAGGTFYFWHSKFNRQGTRISQVLRYLTPAGLDAGVNPMTFTYNPDGSDIRYCFKAPGVATWGAGGGHPTWHGDGVHVTRHLEVEGQGSRFCQCKYDGSDFQILCKKIKASGHPSVEPRGKFLVTDDKGTMGDRKSMVIRLIDLVAEKERQVCEVPTIDPKKLGTDTVFRLDGHPCWSPDYKKVSFQAAPENNRQLFVADLSGVI